LFSFPLALLKNFGALNKFEKSGLFFLIIAKATSRPIKKCRENSAETMSFFRKLALIL
jgi:hypothetical protein